MIEDLVIELRSALEDDCKEKSYVSTVFPTPLDP
jgi:hypothetical protein